MKPGKYVLLAIVIIMAGPLLVGAPQHARAESPEWMSDLTVIQLFNSPNDYNWQGTWDPCKSQDYLARQGTAECQCPITP